MSLLSIPVTFVNGGVVYAADHNSNMTSILNWANGNIDNTNLTTLSGTVTWVVSSNVAAVAVSSSSTVGIEALTQTGVLGAAAASWQLTDSGAQTTGTASWYLSMTSSSSTIPAKKVSNAGTGMAEQTAQSGVLAANKDAHSVSVSGVQTTGRAASYAELTNASSSIPLHKGLHSGTGDLVDLAGSGGRAFNVDNSGRPVSVSQFVNKNFLINGNFEFIQRGSLTVANSASGYGFDRWYVTNGLGTNALIRNADTGVVASLSVTHTGSFIVDTAPTAAKATVFEVWQTLPNEDSIALYNKSVSFSCYVKAASNVTQVGIQLFTKASEAKVASGDTALGSETLVAVNSSTYTLATISGQAIGTAMTSSGVVAVRIRITAVSSGFIYDINNGFTLSSACLNLGNYPAGFSRYAGSIQGELEACQRFYEKSYSVGVLPGTNAKEEGMAIARATTASIARRQNPYFRVIKRASPTIHVYSYAGTDGQFSNAGGTSDNGAVGIVAQSETGFNGISSSAAFTIGNDYWFNWTADSEI